jgi:HAD superfamily, subfamily IIIB (Acid phosphatase)
MVLCEECAPWSEVFVMRRGVPSLSLVRFAAGFAVSALLVVLQPGWARAEGAPDPRLGCDKLEMVPPPNLGEPDNIDLFKKRLLYYRCTAYERDLADVLGKAETWIRARAPQVARPAIVLDIDETSLLNWPRIYQDGYAFFSSFPGGPCNFARPEDVCGDLDWQQKGFAKAIGPTLHLYRIARCLDQPQPCTPIDVFFVTGRREKKYNDEMASDWTLRNLNEAGYLGIERDHLYMRDPNSVGSAAYHKVPARAAIEARGFVIIANIGDQNSDLVGGYAEMTFKLPNPFYFLE